MNENVGHPIGVTGDQVRSKALKSHLTSASGYERRKRLAVRLLTIDANAHSLGVTTQPIMNEDIRAVGAEVRAEKVETEVICIARHEILRKARKCHEPAVVGQGRPLFEIVE